MTLIPKRIQVPLGSAPRSPKAKPGFYVVNCKGEWHHGGALSLPNTSQVRMGGDSRPRRSLA